MALDNFVPKLQQTSAQLLDWVDLVDNTAQNNTFQINFNPQGIENGNHYLLVDAVNEHTNATDSVLLHHEIKLQVTSYLRAEALPEYLIVEQKTSLLVQAYHIESEISLDTDFYAHLKQKSETETDDFEELDFVSIE